MLVTCGRPVSWSALATFAQYSAQVLSYIYRDPERATLESLAAIADELAEEQVGRLSDL